MEKNMRDFIEQIRAVRYTKLHFTIVLTEAGRLPQYKASMLRGGMGQMLLAANCISDRDCKNCRFESECLVRRVMYSRYDITPPFVNGDDSIGYILTCEDYHREFQAGDTIQFSLTLFGKSIVYFSQYMQALYALGNHGIGRDHLHFQVVQVTNSYKKPIMDGYDIYMNRYQILTLGDYIDFRLGQLSETGITHIRCKTPVSIKYQKEEMRECFDREAVLIAALRRLYMLACFEGIETRLLSAEDIPDELTRFMILEQDSRSVQVPRYSSTHGETIRLHGMTGSMQIEKIEKTDVLAELFAALEITYVGKNTSFGFGKIRLE